VPGLSAQEWHRARLVYDFSARRREDSRQVVADNGNVKTRSFCPACGAPVYLTFSLMPDLMAVHAASLDDPARFKPQAVTYSMRGHAWDFMDPSLQKYEKMPPRN
jgi:hypothetical protein